jgi:beta-N-acetylhexosaminidase
MEKNMRKTIQYFMIVGIMFLLTGCFNREDKAATQTPATKEPESKVVTDDASVKGMAKDILKNMTLKEKVAQLFVVNFELLDESKGCFYEFRELTELMKENLKEYAVGGVIFFARNIETREQTIKFIEDLQKTSKYPLFISVDEEGGTVSRIASNSNMGTTVFPSMEEIGEYQDKEYAYNLGDTIGKEIKELGFNLDFAPVADVKTNELNTEIGDRAFGSDGKLVSSMVKEVVKGLQNQGVSATLKHFPGHGDVSGDSHEGAVNVENDLARMRKIDFVPFVGGVKAGVDFIMVSHISISRITEDTVPATLSSIVMQDMIRTELGFDGPIITDAMNMKAITDKYSAGEAAVGAILAGADIILMPNEFDEAYQAVLEAVEDNKISEERIEASVLKSLEVKIRRGLILSDTKLIY